MKRALTPAQETRLLLKHLTGAFGPGKWSTVEALLKKGMLAQVGTSLVVTPAGKEYCDLHHRDIRL